MRRRIAWPRSRGTRAILGHTRREAGSWFGAGAVVVIASALLITGLTLPRQSAGGSAAPMRLSHPAGAQSLALVWGPPALHYPSMAVAPSSSGSAATVPTAAHSSFVPVSSPAAPSSQASGAMGWTPMMHCSKMPRIMGMQGMG